MLQLSLFPNILKSAYLEASESPKKAFYRIWIEEKDGDIRIIKESGVQGRVLDRRSWPVEGLAKAKMIFDKRIANKTDENRKSLRKYKLVERD